MTLLMNEAKSIFLLQDIATPQHVTKKKIQSFKELKSGWHYGEAVPLEQSILDKAISLNREAIRLAFFETDAFPGLNGEVMFTIYYEGHYLEFTFEPDGSVTFYHEEADKEISYQQGLSFQDAKTKIKEFRKETWKASASLTESTMIAGYAGLPVLHLKTQEKIPASRLLVQSASASLTEPFAIISGSTIKELPANLPSFGSSQQKYYLTATG
ncbi:MAG: hypothetical protein GY864_12055 [Desulfobacterales bacterium]|nr:hypothetical protein [Desulfobacterales bacterium]